MIGTEQEMLAEAVKHCALTGQDVIVTDSTRTVIWSIEADTKIDDDDLTYPVIVHLRGAMSSEGVALMFVQEAEE